MLKALTKVWYWERTLKLFLGVHVNQNCFEPGAYHTQKNNYYTYHYCFGTL